MDGLDTKNGVGASDPARAGHVILPSQRKLYDSQVTFEEYVHYASLTREEEKTQGHST